MHRREALQKVGLIVGGTIIGAEFFLSGCKNEEHGASTDFSKDDVAFLDEVAETIIPTTDTPGAKAAKVGAFMTVMVNDCYTADDQKTFHKGINTLNEASEKKYNVGFIKASPQQRHDLLVDLDKEQRKYTKEKKKEDPPHYFRMMKELTLLGYFTSEIGCTQAMRYVPVPGRYESCIPYTKGEKAFV